jgi:feruloyl esterase
MTKSLVEAYFNRGAASKSYFDGCSNGGRMALMEGMRYPEDYDGIIVGSPFMTFRDFIGLLDSAKTQLLPGARIPNALLPAIQAAYVASCDAMDGVTDGLIQNPARCSFNPASMVCSGGNTANCLTSAQADGLNHYLLPLKSASGEVLVPGYPPGTGNFQTYALGPNPPIDAAAAEPWGTLAPARGWALADTTLKFIVNEDPDYSTQLFQHDVADNQVGLADLAKFDDKTIDGNTDDPADLDAFMQQKRKMIIYHGTDDHGLSFYQTERFYDRLDLRMRAQGANVQDDVRLFIVPGMQHCGGGSGPNTFDVLTAMENWVEKGAAPDSVLASGTNPTRTMPLCPYPQAARYKGAGDVMSASSWTCSPNADMRIVGPDGTRAGFKPPSP